MVNKLKNTTTAWENRELGADEEFVVAADDSYDQAVDEALDIETVTLRLPKQLVNQLETIAQFCGTGQQALIRNELQKFSTNFLLVNQKEDYRSKYLGRTTEYKIIRQGDVEMSGTTGYMLVGDGDAVCFHIDPVDRGYVSAYTESDSNCPVIYVDSDVSEESTEIEFSEFPGWCVHAAGQGKSIAISLVRRGSDI